MLPYLLSQKFLLSSVDGSYYISTIRRGIDWGEVTPARQTILEVLFSFSCAARDHVGASFPVILTSKMLRGAYLLSFSGGTHLCAFTVTAHLQVPARVDGACTYMG